MTGQLYIDGIDAYTKFGIFVVKGGYKSLIQYPSLKKVECNDWPEYDGVEVDLSNPVLDAREVTINFVCTQKTTIKFLIELLIDGATHKFNFASIGKTYNLRLISYPSKKVIQTLDVFSLKFAEDLPFVGYTYTVPVDLGVGLQGYEIDGTDFSEYGMYVLEGTYDSVFKTADTKKNLLIKTEVTLGQKYDSEIVFFKGKDVTIYLLLHCNLSNFWTNYEALLYDLIQPDERILTTKYNNLEFPFYYKKSAVSKFFLINNCKVWCEFSITIYLTGFRPSFVNK